jgi:hypothetical protein
MEAYGAGSPITVLAHNNSIHAVKDNHLDAVGAVFWSSSGGSVGKISADKDCVVFYQVTADSFTLALSDPKFHADTITVTVDEPLEPVDLPSGVSATVNPPTTEVTFDVNKGKNTIARFSRINGSSDVLASSYQYPHTPGNTVDGDLGTRWSAEGDGEWIRYDLGEVEEVSAVRIAWYKGNERTARFDVDVSSDDSSWTTVLADAESSGTTLDLETYDFADVSARYVRIVGHGNSTSMWNSITEVEIVLVTEEPCVDADGDGYGSPAAGACPHPELDCNDDDPGVNPGAVETCNQVDDDCDGATDEGCDCTDGEERSCGTDVGTCELGQQTCAGGVWGDCLGGVGPKTEECNGLDDDCDGILPADEADADGDGVSSCEGDCNDDDPAVGPLASEVCNGVDDDCDQTTDEGCPCDDGDTRSCGLDEGVCEPGTQRCQGGVWSECEGGVDPIDEVCGDDLDNDCDGQTDEGCETTDPDPVINGSCACGGRTSDSSLPISEALLALAALAFMLRRRPDAGR